MISYPFPQAVTNFEVVERDLRDLNDLVINNKFDEIKVFIQETKREKGRINWDSYIIKDACRDAVRLGREEIVQLFFNEGLNANAYAHHDGNSGCICPLNHFAARVGNLSMVKLLVEKGARIKDERRFYDEDDHQHAMRAAIKGGHSDVVQYLLENGGSAKGSFSGQDDVQPFLGRAAFDGQKLMVDLLAKHGAQIKSSLLQNHKKYRKDNGNYNSAISKYSDENKSWKLKYSSETEIQKWDKRKQELIEQRDILLQQYSESVQMILDHAIGINFEKEKSTYRAYSALPFLKDLDITGFNFVGVSIDCQPITREMLVLAGLKGAKEAIISCDDIANIEDKERRDALAARLEAKLREEGKIITEDGVVNLVPLADAVSNGHLDVVLVRLSAGIDPNQVASDANLPIVAAAKNGFSDIVRLLAEHPEIDKKSRLTAAEKAKENGHIEIYEYLSSHVDVNERDPEGYALIHKAVKAKDIEEIKRLLSRGADIHLKSENRRTPLSIAAGNAGNIQWGKQASEKDIALLEFLLSNGANPNKCKSYLPLYAAAKAGSVKAVELLLPVTEKRNVKKDGKIIPWYIPVMFDSYGSKEWLQILSVLKKHGADLNARDRRYGDETILHRFIRGFPSFSDIRSTMAGLRRSITGCEDRLEPNPLQKEYEQLINNAEMKFTDVLKKLDFLLENGADPTIVSDDKDKETPLHVLIKKIDLGFIEGATEQVIGRFLKYGIDINTPDAYGFTPLHRAAISDLAAVAYLLDKGADIKARTEEGLTPLHLAAAGRPETTKLLIQKGADVNAVDENGLTPLAFSQQACIDNNRWHREEPYREAQSILMKAGGNRNVCLMLDSRQD